MAAARESRSGAREALEELCTRYWPPLYSFARRRGYTIEQAQDLTQSFFARLLEKGSLEAADRARGKFRSFLLGSFKHFLVNEWDREQAQKRGGGTVPIPIETEVAEGLYAQLAIDTETPEEVFERQWASAILDRAVATLKRECEKAGRGAVFACLEGSLHGEKIEGGHAEAARALGMTEGSVKVTVHRLRRRYRDLLRSEIEGTVSDDQEIDDEIRHLITVLGKG
jgi:RNA polymerase sigma factor (sigma-70 family)